MAKKKLTQYQNDAIAAILGAQETMRNSPHLQRVLDEVNAHPITREQFPAINLARLIIDCIKSNVRIPQSEWENIAYRYYNLSQGTLTTEQLAAHLGTAYEKAHEMCTAWEIDLKSYPI